MNKQSDFEVRKIDKTELKPANYAAPDNIRPATPKVHLQRSFFTSKQQVKSDFY